MSRLRMNRAVFLDQLTQSGPTSRLLGLRFLLGLDSTTSLLLWPDVVAAAVTVGVPVVASVVNAPVVGVAVTRVGVRVPPMPRNTSSREVNLEILNLIPKLGFTERAQSVRIHTHEPKQSV